MFVGVSALVMLCVVSGRKTTDSAASGVRSAGEAVASGVSSAATAVPGLINVDLSNVRNNLALDLKIDKANIPINAQIPITIAANVRGVVAVQVACPFAADAASAP